MSKNKNVPKHFEDVPMVFPTAETPKPNEEGKILFKGASEPPQAPIPPEDIEEFSHDGVLIFKRNKKTGEREFFDADGEVVNSFAIDSLYKSYPSFPEQDDLGTDKDGPLQSREIDINGNSPGHPDFNGKVWATAYRQNYKSGQALTPTIPIKFKYIVALLRGEISEDGKKDSGGSENQEIKKEGNG